MNVLPSKGNGEHGGLVVKHQTPSLKALGLNPTWALGYVLEQDKLTPHSTSQYLENLTPFRHTEIIFTETLNHKRTKQTNKIMEMRKQFKKTCVSSQVPI